ncbi:MAG: GatB/YqeY domain-containing protein [Microgenomates group bacterium]
MIKNQLQADLYQSMKEKNQKQVDFLRFILSRIKNLEIDKKNEATDEEVIALLRKIKIELADALSFSQKSARNDLTDQARFQLEVLDKYLPPDLPEEELKKEIEKIIEENKSLFEKNKMAVMGIAIKTLKSKADPKKISEVFRKYFN